MAEDDIAVTYCENLQPLETLLKDIERPGDFCFTEKVESVMPRVEVEGVGALSFPVPPEQLAKLVGLAVRAPYGRGAETILDTSVRKVWQLPPETVAVTGKSWPATMAGMLERIGEGLGCGSTVISAELYKLLIYDEGGFFTAHRDTEKVAGMFGTLVVVLPSAHRGGELVVRHAGREMVVDLCTSEPSELGVAAFYADCEHEVRPITEGHRVCLVFNLVQSGKAKDGKAKSPAALAAPDHSAAIKQAAGLLRDGLPPTGEPTKIVWLLEHHYTPEGLGFDALKNEDAARMQVIAAAAKLADCAVHLAILHIEEEGAAEPIYEERGYRGRSSDDEDEDSDSDFEVIEVGYSDQSLDEWKNRAGEAPGYGKIPLAPGELLPRGGLDGEEPDEQRLLEASGNEGCSFERSYHRAALVVWREDRFVEVLLQAGPAAAVPYLHALLAKAETAESAEVSRAGGQVVEAARKIVKKWIEKITPGATWEDRSLISREAPKHPEMLALLGRVGDKKITAAFIENVIGPQFEGADVPSLAAALHGLGGEFAFELAATIFSEHATKRPVSCVALLSRLVAKTKSDGAAWTTASDRIAASFVQALAQIQKPADPEVPPRPMFFSSSFRGYQPEKPARILTPEFAADLLDALAEVKPPTLRHEAARLLAALPEVFDVVLEIVPSLKILAERHGTAALGDAEYLHLWRHAADFLLGRSEQPPQLPVDWHLDDIVACQCEDCRALQAFVADPVAREYRFRARADRRGHVEDAIRRQGLDITCTTEKHTSPQILVCTKARQTHKNRCAQHGKDLAAMQTLLAQLPQPADAPAPELVERMSAARTRKPQLS